LVNLNVKEFKFADTEWLDFVLYNRTHKNLKRPYDVVIGPTANDDTMPSINLYLRGALGQVGEPKTKQRLLELIEPMNLPFQFFFGSQQSTTLLQLVERSEIS